MAERRGRGRPRYPRNLVPEDQQEDREVHPDPEPAAPPTGENLSTQVLQGLLQFMQQQGLGGQRRNAQDSMDQGLERFLKFNPPEFHGEVDDEKAEFWLDKVEHIFATMDYSDEQQVKYGAFLMEGTTRNWWRTVQEKWARNDTPSTWNNFTREFRDQYIPQVVREAKRGEFYNLKQGSLSIAKYEAEFHRLSRYAPGMIATEEDRKYKFMQGLREELQRSLLPLQLNTYAETVQAAARVEQGENRLGKPIPMNNQSRPVFKSKSERFVRHTNQSRGERPGDSQTIAKGSPKRLCTFCNNGYHDESKCWRKLGRCFRCGSSTHKWMNCPIPSRSGNTSGSNHDNNRRRSGENAPKSQRLA